MLAGIAVQAQNPIIRDQFSADPSALVVGDRVYVFPSHDIKAPAEYARKDWFCMADYHVFSSDNLTDWTDHGMIVDQWSAPWVKVIQCGLLTVSRTPPTASTISSSRQVQNPCQALTDAVVLEVTV